MLNYTQFFPTGSGGGGASSTPDNRLNRRIFTGELTSCSWPVPPGVTNIEVHVWGGGGGGCSAGQVVDTLGASGGGGGGGYARTTLDVTDSDILSITVGGEGQTSSLTVPTQTPGSPISATGGSNGSNSVNTCQPTGLTYCYLCGGSGGSGSVNLAPTQPRDYCFTASGGTGGLGSCCAFPGTSGTPGQQCGGCAFLGAGGAAGSPLGPGGNGASACFGGGGGGIGGPGYRNAGGSKYGALNISCNCPGYYTTFGGGGEGDQFNNIDGIGDGVFSGQYASCFQDTWWKVEDIKGAGGLSVCEDLAFFNAMTGGTGAGGGGGATYKETATCTWWLVQGARGGFLGGAGTQVNVCVNYPCSGNPSACWCCTLYRPGIDGKGGCAGGSSGSPGTPGVVIIYW